MEVTLALDQADDPPPICPKCTWGQHHQGDARMRQEFKPFAIGGSTKVRAGDLALKIAEEDYGVADIEVDGRKESVPKVRFKDQGTPGQASFWGAAGAAITEAAANGRQTRLHHGGSGLDILQRNIKDGTEPDLIEVSKKRSMRIW